MLLHRGTCSRCGQVAATQRPTPQALRRAAAQPTPTPRAVAAQQHMTTAGIDRYVDRYVRLGVDLDPGFMPIMRQLGEPCLLQQLGLIQGLEAVERVEQQEAARHHVHVLQGRARMGATGEEGACSYAGPGRVSGGARGQPRLGERPAGHSVQAGRLRGTERGLQGSLAQHDGALSAHLAANGREGAAAPRRTRICNCTARLTGCGVCPGLRDDASTCRKVGTSA